MSITEFDGPDDPILDLSIEGRFRVGDDKQAAWAMRKLAALEGRISTVVDIADQERERIAAWQESETAKLLRDADYFRGILTEYAASERAVNDRKSITLPHGVVKSRLGQPKWSVTDETLEWARANSPDLIAVKESVNLSLLKTAATAEPTDSLGLVAITADGEIIPGVSIEQPQITFTIETTGGK
jgi:hypothetical protein